MSADTTSGRPDPADVLHRLRTDVPREAVLADPPPVPDSLPATPDMGLRRAEPEADAERVETWMDRPHLRETWEQPWPAERWARTWRAMLSGTYSVPLILTYRGRDVGYVEVYRPLRDEIGAAYRSEPHDLGFHIAVGEPDLTGRGIFSPFLAALAGALLAADPECRTVLVEPGVDNAPMHRALRKSGWTDCGEVQQRADRRVRLFLFPADGTDPRGLLLHEPEDGDLA